MSAVPSQPRFTVSLPDPTTHRFQVRLELPASATDLQTFQNLLTTRLTPAPNVEHVKTSFTIRTSKALPGVPVPQ